MRQKYVLTLKSSITTLLWFNRYQTRASQRLFITKLSNKRLMLFLCWAPLAFSFFCMSFASAFVYAWCIALRIWNDCRRRCTFLYTESSYMCERRETTDVYWYGRSIWKSVLVYKHSRETFSTPSFFFLGL